MLWQKTQKLEDELLMGCIAVDSPLFTVKRCPKSVISLFGFSSLFYEPISAIHLVSFPWMKRSVTMPPNDCAQPPGGFSIGTSLAIKLTEGTPGVPDNGQAGDVPGYRKL